MAIEAPYSKYRKQNLWIFVAICIGLAIWCTYDGYYSESWIAEHTRPDGSPDAYLTFNRQAPPYLIAAAAVLFIFWVVVRNKKITAEENELVLSAGEKIPYSSIQKIDKTNFDSKGFFIIGYKKDLVEVERKISNRSYDNLKPVLEHLVSKIS